MAKTFDIDKVRRGKSLSEKVKNLEMEAETQEIIKAVETKPDVDSALEAISKDSKLSDKDKKYLSELIMSEFVDLFNFDNCPDDYETLKKEAKFFAGLTQYSFLLMAQRVMKIRDEKLYQQDGYLDFKSFVENELPINRQSAYNYISILECFGVQLVGHGNDLEYSKLLPFVPIIRTNNPKVSSEAVKKGFIEDAKNKTKKEMVREAEELKFKLGIVKEKKGEYIDRLFMGAIHKLPDELSAKDVLRIQGIISDLHLIIDQNKSQGGSIKGWKETFFKNLK